MTVKKQDIDNLFKQLRKEGFTTLEADMCCTTCSWALLDRPENEGKKVAFYHDQDYCRAFEETLIDEEGDPDDIENYTNSDEMEEDLYIAFGQQTNKLSDEEATAIGQTVADAAVKLGLKVDWGKDPGTRIKILP